MWREKYLTNWCLMTVIVLGLVGSVSGQIYVDAGATGANDGTNWDDAYVYLQNALDSAVAGDEIWVAQGIYKPDQGGGQIPGDRNATFQLISGVTLLGGFGDETILSGDLLGNDIEVDPQDLCFEASRFDNSYTVVAGTGTNDTSVLDGFTITGGYANKEGSASAGNRGGGIFIDPGNPTIRHCVLIGNAAGAGGGIYNWHGSSPTITNCSFIGNGAYLHGGALQNSVGCSPSFSNCKFSGNVSMQAGGGGIYNYNSNPVLSDCKFTGNSSSLNGGGMVNYWYCSPELIDCEFHDNSALYGGGLANDTYASAVLINGKFNGNSAPTGAGMFNDTGCQPELTDCKFNGNLAENEGGGMYNDSNSDPILTNCKFNGNKALSHGGAMRNWASFPIITDCSFQGNKSGDLGGGIANGGGGQVTLEHCLLWGNKAKNAVGEFAQIYDVDTPIINNCCIQGWTGYYGGTGNTGKKPKIIK